MDLPAVEVSILTFADRPCRGEQDNSVENVKNDDELAVDKEEYQGVKTTLDGIRGRIKTCGRRWDGFLGAGIWQAPPVPAY